MSTWNLDRDDIDGNGSDEPLRRSLLYESPPFMKSLLVAGVNSPSLKKASWIVKL